MQRHLGLLLFLFGAVGGWWIGRPSVPPTIDEVPAAQAWQHFRSEAALAQVCQGDVAPHPAWVALALAVSTLTLLTIASPHPWQTWQIALGLRAASSTVAVPW